MNFLFPSYLIYSNLFRASIVATKAVLRIFREAKQKEEKPLPAVGGRAFRFAKLKEA